MDPVANLNEQLELARALFALNEQHELDDIDDDTLLSIASDAWRLAELVLDLDAWQRRGGFSPYATPTPHN
jgi:hypothetical protein